ncbi:MAG: dihydroorotase [Lachnospiraceae bacterium]
MLLIKNGHIIDPANHMDSVAHVIVEQDRIKEITSILPDETMFDTIIDAQNMVVSPGLIDVHVHFRDPGFTYKEDLHTGSLAALHGGFTSVVLMANTNPVVDSPEVLSDILERAKVEPIRIFQSAAITKGLKGEELTDFPTLTASGATGFTDDGIPLMNDTIVREAMKLSAKYDVPLSFHEEDASMITNPGVNAGKIAKELGLTGAPSVSETILVQRDIELAKEYGARIQIQHISSKDSVEAVRQAKKAGIKVTAEVTPHHFSLTEDSVLEHKTLAKMNPPLRTEEDRQAIIQGLRDGTIDMIATDHAPHSKEEKEREFTKAPSGILGLETALSLGITNLVRPGYLTLSELIEKMSYAPAQLYHLPLGTLSAGAPADIILFNPEKTRTITGFHSKSSNSPFLGQTLYGTLHTVICKGIAHTIS